MGNKKLFFLIILILQVFFGFTQNSQNQDNLQNQINIEENLTFSSSDSYVDNDNQNTQNEIKTPSTIGVFVRMIFVLIIVIALIYSVFWFIKKKTNIVKTDDDYLRRVSYINLAPGKSVEVITLLDKGYLIGVTDSNISLLGEIDDKELIQAMNINADKKNNIKKPVNFTQVLDMFLIKGNKQKNVFTDNENEIEKENEL